MATSAADDGSSLAPIVNEGETTAEAGAGAVIEECAEVEEMKVGAAAAVEEPDEEAARENDPDDDDEDVEEEEEEEEEEVEEEEVETADGLEADELMEPLSVLKPGEEGKPEEFKEEKEELDGEPKETEPSEEEPEEVEKCKEGDGVAEEEGLVDGSMAKEINEIFKQGYGKSVNTDKDKDADQLSSGSDGGSRSGDMQNSELAGGLEVFVDDLPLDCVEEDIAMAFSQSGEIKSVRIIKNSSTENNKDVAFVCYASIEAAKKALAEFKEGIEVKGKMVRVSACEDNYTLYLGNIGKGWTRDQVLNTLKSIGIQECKISFPTYKGGSRGFAFLKFASHYYARAAFRRLMKSDAIFGTDRSAKVSFYQTSTKSSKNLMEAKKVYLEHVPLSWDENKIKEYCEEYGEILKVDVFQISKNVENETISFVEFSTSKGALACVAGINKAKIVDGSFKLCAYLAWPKSALKVNSSAPSNATTTTEKDKTPTKKVVVDKNLPHKFQKGDKSKLTSQTKEANMRTNSSGKLPNDNDTKLTSQGAAEVPQTSKSSEGKRKVGKNKHASANPKPLKKARNNCNVDESQLTSQCAAVLQTPNTSKGKRKSSKNKSIYINEKPLKKARNTNFGGSSRSKSYASDLEPHAGFISPTIRDHGSDTYNRQRTAQYSIHPIDVHPYARVSPSAYSGYRSHAGYEAVYPYEYPRNRAPTPPSGSYVPRRGHY